MIWLLSRTYAKQTIDNASVDAFNAFYKSQAKQRKERPLNFMQNEMVYGTSAWHSGRNRL